MKLQPGDRVKVIDTLTDNCVIKGDVGAVIPHDKWEDIMRNAWASEEEFNNDFVKVDYSICGGKENNVSYYTLISRLKLDKIENWKDEL